ncbi:MAG: hypothetical protein JXQ82_07705 [Methanomicrobiaceae archaeon]|nr:hypothetical protein [Methanomicrobiaceae archaeon]
MSIEDRSKFFQEEADETFEFDLEGDTFTCRKISGLELAKCLDKRNLSDMYRNLILKCMVEPKFSTKEIEKLSAKYFMGLGSRILQEHGADIEDFLNTGPAA